MSKDIEACYSPTIVHLTLDYSVEDSIVRYWLAAVVVDSNSLESLELECLAAVD